MKLKIDEKLRAIRLREKGYSLGEIVEIIEVAKSTVSVWVRNVPLTKIARDRLLTKYHLGRSFQPKINARGQRKRSRHTRPTRLQILKR